MTEGSKDPKKKKKSPDAGVSVSPSIKRQDQGEGGVQSSATLAAMGFIFSAARCW